MIATLKAGALAQGYSGDLWRLARVGETLTGRRYCRSGVWRLGLLPPLVVAIESLTPNSKRVCALPRPIHSTSGACSE